MSDEKRKDARLGVRLEVCLIADREEHSLTTRDLSNSGVFLETDGGFVLEQGTIVHMRVAQPFEDGDPPLVKAEVVRIDKDGIALRFVID